LESTYLDGCDDGQAVGTRRKEITAHILEVKIKEKK
jgi:hypothetical protein